MLRARQLDEWGPADQSLNGKRVLSLYPMGQQLAHLVLFQFQAFQLTCIQIQVLRLERLDRVGAELRIAQSTREGLVRVVRRAPSEITATTTIRRSAKEVMLEEHVSVGRYAALGLEQPRLQVNTLD